MRVAALIPAAFVLAAGGVSAFGQGVGGNSPTNTTYTIQRIYTTPEEPLEWGARVGSWGNPIGVELDPFGPVWSKGFNTNTGEPILPGERIAISETLLVQGARPWTGWGARILTDGFAWYDSGGFPAFTVLRNDGSGSPVPGLSVQYIGPAAIGVFNPLMAGASVQVFETVIYTGTQPFSGTLQLEQFPIPEPSTLLSFVLLALLLRRR